MQIPVVHNHSRPDGIYHFDARGIAKRFRHAAIFGALDALNPGERMRFIKDHGSSGGPAIDGGVSETKRTSGAVGPSQTCGEEAPPFQGGVTHHNPLPLLQQMQARYGDAVEVSYLEQGEQGVVIDFIRR